MHFIRYDQVRERPEAAGVTAVIAGVTGTLLALFLVCYIKKD
ncbi:hypothetical protein [Paenibacillus favisporus]